MEWKLFADLAETVGEKRVSAGATPGDTVEDALEALLSEHPELADRVLDENGDLAEHVSLLHNGTDVGPAERRERELETGDELALFPPVSGGRTP